MRPPLAAIFFMTYFHRARGAMAPSAPPGSTTGTTTEDVKSRHRSFILRLRPIHIKGKWERKRKNQTADKKIKG